MKNAVTTLATSLLIRSSSFMQAIRKLIKSGMGLLIDRIGPWTVELAALEHLENRYRLIMGEML